MSGITIKVTAKQRETLAAIESPEIQFNEQRTEATFLMADPAAFVAAQFSKDKALVTALTKKLAAAAPAKPAEAAEAAEDKPAPRKVNKPYINKQRKRRNTGTTTRILYLLAEDRPADALAPAKADDGTELAFAVECVDHGGHQHHASYAAAYTAAKNSAEWCTDCSTAATWVAADKAQKAEAAKNKGTTTNLKTDGTVTVSKPKAKTASKTSKASAKADKAEEKASA